ncbi:transcription-repair coupling factor [Alphaproteobacteria bacterium]|nr:transcription-repair coupling factor [Alphaproteobacteria bacterium]
MFDFKTEFKDINSINGIRDGLIPFVLAYLTKKNNVFYIAMNDLELSQINRFISSNFKEINVCPIPSWDCLPFDVSSPNYNIISERVKTFTDMSFKLNDESNNNNLFLTTINGVFLKTASVDFYKQNFINIKKEKEISFNNIRDFLIKIGYSRVQTVRELGEFSIRGSILDVFPIGHGKAFRIDFLGDYIDSIKEMDPLTQRSNLSITEIDIYPSNEYLLNEKNIQNFRSKFRSVVGSKSLDSDIYEKITSGIKFNGIEHFLPLMHQNSLCSIFDFLNKKNLIVLLTKNFSNLISRREEEILSFSEDRILNNEDYSSIKVEDLYLTKFEIEDKFNYFKTIKFNEFDILDNEKSNLNLNSKPLIIDNFVKDDEHKNKVHNIIEFCINENKKGKKVLLVTEEQARLKNLINFFEESLVNNNIKFETIEIQNLIVDNLKSSFSFTVSPYLESFYFNNQYVIFDRDLFGIPKQKKRSWRRKTENFLKDVNSIDAGDLVAHIDHGIGRYDGLEKISSNGIDHDCLRLIYYGGDKLYLPVENMNLLSRVGDSSFSRELDKLGAASWQSRKANVKKRIRDMAEKLIRVAAQREVINTDRIEIPKNYEEFSNKFPFELTDDQENAINEIISDFEVGKLMDRLICGDVGFGKTEVAIRASFIIASAGYQVALVAPTTILVKQHYKSFFERFKNTSIKVSALSRMTNVSERQSIKQDLISGDINIIIGTHALLSNDVDFNNLGLLIIDEEQHFGVAQKEKIKELQGNIHVLTLTATPIPRTLQLSLSGIKKLSLISTPPVNRLAIRTFVIEWDSVVLIDALLREKNRGGQIFVVCPRVKDIDSLYDRINKMTPELSISVAHGQMKVNELDKSINDFSEGKVDILISTNIIESGIDIPNANTMIIHKSDMFGLSQLYQLRGRVGRGKQRAYTYFTIEKNKILLKKSQQRLDVIKTLDNLGAGFSLASYDMDIRGAGNLLGDEQSGQIKEVGVELYQDMLKDAVNSFKNGSKQIEEVWSPSISLGLSVLIPENYVYDLSTRMSLYRKAGELLNSDDIKNFSDELFDRFGPPPSQVNNLLTTLMIKNKCLKCKINFVDAGPKGLLLGFKNNFFKETEKLITLVNNSSGQLKIRPDQKLFFQKSLKTNEDKIETALSLINQLETL